MTLVEVIVATALFAVASVACAHLLVWAARAQWGSGAATIALAAAQAKLEELQSLEWRFDALGNRVSDTSSDLAVTPASSGGRGLTPSPANALVANVPGYADYLDDHGHWAGRGDRVPANAAFVRRWAIRPMAAAPDDGLVFQVLVVPLANGGRGYGAAASGRGAGESLLTTARARMR